MALLTFGTRDQTDEREEEQAYKTCPICGSPVFSDMDVCYSCLFEWEAAVEPEPSGFGPAISRDIAAIADLPLLRVRTPYADFDAPVPDEGLTIGRSPSNGIAIHSRTVEREHALIVPGPEGLASESSPGLLSMATASASLTLAMNPFLESTCRHINYVLPMAQLFTMLLETFGWLQMCWDTTAWTPQPSITLPPKNGIGKMPEE